ncbi:sensor histidine kinase [Oceanospirillum sediminis]|uniref:histidine kinase n=1 Tax=Oceanospirillum sediminis TaxID=2760088 RepID=A0A839IKL1_9GAMM|nr:HAMP domain-containing sensor histidine kinase [Oceanospirillum sediminis]MBB1485264.1 HAMP domain-containing histidine kinase [Oceanospirillum sediminis]
MAEDQGADGVVEQETESLHRQLMEQEALASIGSMVPGVTHEINTPLGVSVTSLSFLRSELSELQDIFARGELTEQNLTDFLDNCEEVTLLLDKNLRRATRLIQSFKALAANQAVVEISVFSLVELLQDVVSSLRHETKRFVSSVHVDCPEDLQITSDAGALTQIISNLVMNSIRHGFDEHHPSPAQGKISIESRVEGDTLVLIYRDNGKGIHPDIYSRIFEPYFTTRKGHGGTGLGLCIVKDLVENRLHGCIEYIPETSGACFRIAFPLAAEKNIQRPPV